MPLGPGTRLGPYEVIAAIGAGGMGEVYRARDGRLHRDVAIKVLPAGFTSDPDRLARFEQEARATAALNHPNVLAVYDIGTDGSAPYIVSELLDGSTLREQIPGLPLRKAIDYAIQIARGLAAAHEKGIVHRDLKPENIAITAQGRVKILDFGLAKLVQPEPSGTGMSMLPTTPAINVQSPPHTIAGVVMGTMGYMAPEQVRGVTADHRADIFAFGAILYEMLSGRRAFGGETAMDTMMAIAKESPPDLPLTARHIPPALGRIVDRCLEKDPSARFKSADDLAFALEGVTSTDTTVVVPRVQPRRRVRIAAGAVVALIAVSALGYSMLRSSTPSLSSVSAHLTATIPEGDQLVSPDGPNVAVSPDGSQLVYAGIHADTTQLFVRPINRLEYKAIPATEGAIYPFFSPDGRSVAFFAQGKLKRVTLAEGTVQVICEAPFPRGGSWGPDGTIYFAPTNLSGFSKVPASGGKPVEVTTLDRAKGEVSHRWPQVLPDGKTILMTVWTGPGRDEHSVQVVSLATGERHVLIEGADTGRYVQTGHLVYGRQDRLLAIPMDLNRLELLAGTPTAMSEEVMVSIEGAAYAISESGLLAYVAGAPHREDRRIVWVDREGRVDPLPVPPRRYEDLSLSADGRLAAVSLTDSTIEVWIYDIARNTFTRVTTAGGGSSQAGLWTPDGSHIVYRGTRAGARNLFWKMVDRGDGEERLTTRPEAIHTPQSWSPDGKTLVFVESSQTRGSDISILAIADRESHSLIATPANENQPRVSPDGKWLAYTSDESGRSEIYVQSFPTLGRRWQISIDGGDDPAWSPDGRELFFLHLDQLIAVPVKTAGGFSAGAPRPLFAGSFVRSPTASSGYAVSPDGRRFLRVQAIEPESRLNEIQVVTNLFEELRQLGSGGH